MSHILGIRFQLNASTVKGVWRLAGEEDGIPCVELESYPNDFVYASELRQEVDGFPYHYDLTDEELEERHAAITRRFEDPWALLQDFTALKTIEDLLAFLNATGHFCDPDVPIHEKPEWLFNAGDLRNGVTDFWELQELLAQMLLSRRPLVEVDQDALPLGWKEALNAGFHFKIKKSFGEYVAEVNTHETLPSLIAVAQLKIMRGGRFRVCKRADCGRLFEYETRGRRENHYCSHLCAHTVWQRKTRKTKITVRDERRQFGYGIYAKNR
jgi:hypothetical protein